MINKTMKMQFKKAQQILADAETALQSLYDMQQDLLSAYEEKGEKAQEKLMEKETWLQGLFDADIDGARQTIEALCVLEVE